MLLKARKTICGSKSRIARRLVGDIVMVINANELSHSSAMEQPSSD